ncbi:MAG: hypothetical protein E7182_06040 [Erysipelotrichaceae bacterium]|nr:hypothetical protein [Erysipelotrichaceae bacterium]
MNNRKVNIVLGILVSVLAIVSVFILFATAFGKSDYSDHPSTLGSCFNVMFGNQGFEPVPGLIVAFVLQCVAILFALIGTILPGKIGGLSLGIAAASMVGGGILWLLAPSMFSSINPIAAQAETVTHGTGTILTAVICFLGGLLGLYGGYRAIKE